MPLWFNSLITYLARLLVGLMCYQYILNLQEKCSCYFHGIQLMSALILILTWIIFFFNSPTINGLQSLSTERQTTDESTPLLTPWRPSSDEATPLLAPDLYAQSLEELDVEIKQPSFCNSPSLWLALMRVFGLDLLQAHTCKLFADLLIFVGPMLQG